VCGGETIYTCVCVCVCVRTTRVRERRRGKRGRERREREIYFLTETQGAASTHAFALIRVGDKLSAVRAVRG